MDFPSKSLSFVIIFILLPICYADECYNELEDYQQGNIAFTQKFLYETAKSKPGVSLIFSPFSVMFLLAQLALYATGNSLEQLLKLLNFKDQSDIIDVIPDYIDTLNSQKNVTLSLAEKVYGNVQYKFSECFLWDSKNTFKAEAQNLDFGNSNRAAGIINKWVAGKTGDLIKDLVSPDQLSGNTVLVLVNAIYFKGDWDKQFDSKETKEEDFYVNKKKTVKVSMMKQTASFKYTEVNSPSAQVIELPYKSNNFTFLAWLPKSRDGIDDLINGLTSMSPGAFTKVIKNLFNQKVELSMPKLNSTTTIDLRDILIKDNVTDIFNPQDSGLEGIVDSQQPSSLYVSSATQKAAIEIDEKGSKAAAANAIIGQGATAVTVGPKPFIANHPFIYFIMFEKSPIFTGLYYGDKK